MEHLSFEEVWVLHDGHKVLYKRVADLEAFINWDISILLVTEPNHKVSEEVHDLDSWVVIAIDQTGRLIYSQAAYIEAIAERPLAKVKEYTLTLL